MRKEYYLIVGGGWIRSELERRLTGDRLGLLNHWEMGGRQNKPLRLVDRLY